MTAHKRRPSGYTQPADWKRTVARIIRRDGALCHVCGKPGATSADHVVPVSEGGGHDDGNLRAVHPAPCHAAKTEAERRRAITRRARRRPARRNPNLIG